jgi:hypothetical protein
MEIKLIRKDFTENSTIGDWVIDDVFYSFTLEDRDRQRQPDGSIIPWAPALKVYGLTAIPYGTYEVITDYSVRFKKVMPLILGVPDFKGVRVHILNIATESEGCVGLGLTKTVDFIGQSKKAFDGFIPKLLKGLAEGKVILTVTAE